MFPLFGQKGGMLPYRRTNTVVLLFLYCCLVCFSNVKWRCFSPSVLILDGQLHTSIYDKRDDFNFHITNFPFPSRNIPTSPAYSVFFSQLIRYARYCSSCGCSILRATRLSSQTGIRQGTLEIIIDVVLWPIRGSYQTTWSFPLTNVKWHSVSWPYTMTIPQWSDFVPNSTFYQNLRGFHGTFATDVACRQGTLTPPDTYSRPFGSYICSTCWDQFFYRNCRYFSRLCSSNTPRYFLDFVTLPGITFHKRNNNINYMF